MKILSKLAKINAFILISLFIILAIEFGNAHNGIDEIILAFWFLVFCFFVLTMLLIGLISSIFFLIDYNYIYKFNKITLKKMFIAKISQKLIYVVTALLIYIQYYNNQQVTLINYLHYSYDILHFRWVDLCTSLIFIKSFMSNGKYKCINLFIWLATIVPILDIVVIALLMQAPKKLEDRQTPVEK